MFPISLQLRVISGIVQHHYLSETEDFYLNDFLHLNFASSRKRRNADGKFKSSSSELSEGINKRKREAAKRQCKEIQLSTIFVFVICPFCYLKFFFVIMKQSLRWKKERSPTHGEGDIIISRINYAAAIPWNLVLILVQHY